jgi:signal transduction histidine kinase
MMRAPSLERRLVAVVVTVVTIALSTFSLLLYGAFRDGLLREFDARLEDDARGIADMVEEQADGTLELEGSLSDFERTRSVQYFEAWDRAGHVIFRSPRLGTRDLPRTPNPGTEHDLPDGRKGRLIVADAHPRPDDADGSISPKALRVAVAKSTDELRSTTTLLARLLALALVLVLAISVVACIVAIRRGIAPVNEVARKLATLTVGDLGDPVQAGAVPIELTPLIDKLNDLLHRLHAGFARERQFTSDASHELRTPLAAVRSILEVSLASERQPGEYRTALNDALSVAKQMGELVEDLLMLARAEAGALPLTNESLAIRDLVTDAFAPFLPIASSRGLRIENLVTDDAIVISDRDKLRVVVSNLLGNAVQYATAGGAVSVRSEPQSGVVLEVSNSAPPLAAADLERIFERFVRLDSSRRGTTEHAGIGLALVRSLCGALGFRIVARNEREQQVVFRVELAAPDQV